MWGIVSVLVWPQHSFSGHGDSMMQTLDRWHSAAFLRYIQTPKARLANASASLVEQAGTAQLWQ